MLACAHPIGAAPARFVFVPDEKAATGSWLEDDTWLGEGNGWAIRLKLLGEEERIDYLESRTGFRVDPFASRPDQEPRYLGFRFEMLNQAEGPITFRTENAWLRAAKAQLLTPTSVNRLSTTARLLKHEMPDAYDVTSDVIIDRSVTLEPGQRLEGLLVYRRPNEGTRKFHLGFHFTLPSGDLGRFTADYRRVREKSEKEKKR